MTYTITTQAWENYGAHNESGKFKDGRSYWKFKCGMQYVVTGVDRLQDAVAFIVSVVTHNSIFYKEFVSSFIEGREVDGCGYVEVNVREYMDSNQKDRNDILRKVIWPED